MRKIFVMLSVVFSAAFGTVLAAAEDIIPSEFSDTQKQALKLAFCERMYCHSLTHSGTLGNLARCGGVEIGETPKIKLREWKFLIKEMSVTLNWHQIISEPYVKAFQKDLERSIALDDFRFTKDHALNCIADLRQMFEDNYTPTFNIELLR